MPAFTSPFANPTEWDLSLEEVTVPPGLRYAGYRLLAVRARATRVMGGEGEVRVPALGAVRSADDPAARRTWVELQVTPFPIRHVVAALPFGAPTFYFLFDGAGAPRLAPDTLGVQGSTLLRASTVAIAVAGQDRVMRDPSEWCAAIVGAIRTGGGNDSAWRPFAEAISAALAPRGLEPVLLCDHAGQTLVSGTVELLAGADAPRAITLQTGDHGDLLRAAHRVGIGNLWTLARPLRLQPRATEAPVPGTPPPIQIAALEDGATAAGLMEVTASRRHLAFTDLHSWFAPQFATPRSGPTLVRFTRGNRIKFHLNGKSFYDELFRLLATEDVAGGGWHHTGWVLFNVELTRRRAGDPANYPLTPEALARSIQARNGSTRLLLTRFFQLDDPPALMPLAFLVVTGLFFLGLAVDRANILEFNDEGLTAFALALVGALAGGGYITGTSARNLEPNKAAIDRFNTIAADIAAYAAYPMLVADNPRGLAAIADTPTGTQWILNAALSLLHHFGVYHQKFSVVKAGGRHAAFYGGIDLIPQQLDDVHHLIPAPFHDLQARVEGPAVRDLAITFAQRWTRDGRGSLAFEVPTAETLRLEAPHDPTPPCAMQVARTYYAPAAVPAEPPRAFDFAPDGDRTIHDTILRGLGNAREFIYLQDQYLTPPATYVDAFLAAVRQVKQVTISVPGQTDVPFGDEQRSDFIRRLREAGRDAGVSVRIGYPRRHLTLPNTTLSASAGRLRLGLELSATPTVAQAEPGVAGATTRIRLGPPRRVPPPPFFIACEGELMRVYDEAPAPTDVSSNEWKDFLVARGPEVGLVNPPGRSLSGSDPPRLRRHEAGAPVSIVELTGIYVHCKLLIVDDVFLAHGSANTNRRGFFSDGELNVSTVPEALRMSPGNPIAALRRRVWAEMLNLPEEMAGPILDDPVEAGVLFDRSPLLGNRFTDIDWRPPKLLWSLSFGDSALRNALNAVLFSIEAGFAPQVFAVAGDPTCRTDPRP